MSAVLKKQTTGSWLAQRLGLTLEGEDRTIAAVAPLRDLAHGDLTFCTRKAIPQAEIILSMTAQQEISAVIIGWPMLRRANVSVISSPSPRLDFTRALRILSEDPGFVVAQEPPKVHCSCIVGNGVRMQAGAVIGMGTMIGHDCFIGPDVRIGDYCTIKPHAVIGADGFGFVRAADGKPLKMPHLGSVSIGQRVEIGSFTTVSRGTLGDTRIGDYTKIDDHVHVGHNCEIGTSAIITAHAELSGGVHVGDRAWLAPNSCIREQLSIGDDAVVGIGAVVVKSVPNGRMVYGNPAVDKGEGMR
jgi:UDP-3-O-[3-hydroxymyristoyl] glucosamine N-acyltransferase